MSPEYSLCLQSIVYVPRVQFMSPECSLCPHGAVNHPRVQSSLCPVYVQSTVYVPRVQSIEYSLCPRVQFMSIEYS